MDERSTLATACAHAKTHSTSCSLKYIAPQALIPSHWPLPLYVVALKGGSPVLQVASVIIAISIRNLMYAAQGGWLSVQRGKYIGDETRSDSEKGLFVPAVAPVLQIGLKLADVPASSDDPHFQALLWKWHRIFDMVHSVCRQGWRPGCRRERQRGKQQEGCA